MKTVLITGSTGFLGAHIVDHFLENTDWKIIGIDSLRHRGDSLRIDTGHPESLQRYGFYTHDLSAPISDRLANKIGPVDYIINCASESHVDRSIDDPVPFVMNNISLQLNMLEYARKVKPSVFIQFSTDEVYGPAEDGVNFPEWSPIIPSNPYSASKAAQEALAISYWRTYAVPIVITNTMNLIGERQDPEKFVPLVISRVMRGETVQIHGFPDDIGKRYYLHCRNAADAVLFLLRNTSPIIYDGQVTMPDRWNVVGDVEVDNLTMALTVAEICGRNLKYEFVPFTLARAGHDRRYALDGSKLKNAGWKSPVDFRDSLRKTVEWTVKHASVWCR